MKRKLFNIFSVFCLVISLVFISNKKCDYCCVKSNQIASSDVYSGINNTRGSDSTTNFIYFFEDNIDSVKIEFAKTCFENARYYYVSNGFRAPIKRLIDTKYRVELYYNVLYENGNAIYGNTYYTDIFDTSSSYIRIYGVGSLGDDLIESTIYHELFHAVQKAYTTHYNWFVESTARMMEFIVCNTVYETTTLNFCNSTSGLFNLQSSLEYGSWIFPYYLYRDYGGIDTIVEIFDSIAYQGHNMSESTFVNAFSDGLNNAGISKDFDDLLNEFYTKIYYYNYNFSEVFGGSDAFVQLTPVANNNIHDSDSAYSLSNVSLESKAKSYYKFINGDTAGQSTFSYQGNNSNLIFNFIIENGNSLTTHESLLGSQNFSFSINNANCDSVIVVIVNLTFNLQTISFSINKEHLHSFIYIYYNNDRHRKKCLLDYNSLEAHTVRESEVHYIDNEQHADCLYCNHDVNISRTIVYIITSGGIIEICNYGIKNQTRRL